MWNRLQHISWIAVFLLALASTTGIAHAAAPVEPAAYAQETGSSSSAISAPTTNKGDYSKFAGLWVAHSSFMVVAQDGNVRFGARVYNWCGPKVPQPCDSIVNDQLRYGYHAQILLSSASDYMAYGKVIASNFQPSNQNTSVTLMLGPDNTLIYDNNGTITFLCGQNAPTGACGA